jgi:hypothetical protein
MSKAAADAVHPPIKPLCVGLCFIVVGAAEASRAKDRQRSGGLIMTSVGGQQMPSQTPAGAVWTKACQALRHELGEAAFGSWLAQAALREAGGQLYLVTPTGVARDWIRRNAWRRIGELWAQHDPEGRILDLKSRMEFESDTSGMDVIAEAIEVMDPVATDAPAIAPMPPVRPTRTAGLQERFTFDSFVPGPANEFAHAVARRVASWADGHFNPVYLPSRQHSGDTREPDCSSGTPRCSRPRRRRTLTRRRGDNPRVKITPIFRDFLRRGEGLQRR